LFLCCGNSIYSMVISFGLSLFFVMNSHVIVFFFELFL
jgi:hypothetical protein